MGVSGPSLELSCASDSACGVDVPVRVLHHFFLRRGRREEQAMHASGQGKCHTQCSVLAGERTYRDLNHIACVALHLPGVPSCRRFLLKEIKTGQQIYMKEIKIQVTPNMHGTPL